jgi:hypothetical protein
MYKVTSILAQTFRVNVLQYRGREGLNGDIYIYKKNSAKIVIGAECLREHYSTFNN